MRLKFLLLATKFGVPKQLWMVLSLGTEAPAGGRKSTCITEKNTAIVALSWNFSSMAILCSSSKTKTKTIVGLDEIHLPHSVAVAAVMELCLCAYI
jgi:hypothetical protein